MSAEAVAARETPSSGRLFYAGNLVEQRSRRELRQFRRWAEVVFQDPYSSPDPRMSAVRTVMEPMLAGRNGRSTSQLRTERGVVSKWLSLPHVVPERAANLLRGQADAR
jgi:ABC-type microcin C transport system duplicated ATPase subunit YejF